MRAAADAPTKLGAASRDKQQADERLSEWRQCPKRQLHFKRSELG
jgi:hypothetical protein